MKTDALQDWYYPAEESATAKWILHKWVRSTEHERGHWIVKCSLCRKKSDVEVERCPACGAKMAL